MKNLIRVFKNKLPQVFIIFALLILEAYCDLSLPSYTASIVDIGIQNADLNYITNIGTLMLIMVAISVFATIGVSYFSSRVSSGYAKDLRKVIYTKVLKFSNHELNRISRSSLITRSTNDVNQVQNVLGFLFTTLFFAPILGVGSIVKAFEFGGNLSSIIFITFIAVLILLIIVVVRVLPYFKITQEIIDKMNRTAREILLGIPVIKAFVRQDFENEKFGHVNEEFRDVNLYVFRNLFVLMPAMTLILNLILFWIFLI